MKLIISFDPLLERKLFEALQTLVTQGNKIMALLDTLTADVATETTVNQSAITLITGLIAQIKAAGTDPVALKALTDQMEAQNTALAAAVSTGTSSAPPVPPAS